MTKWLKTLENVSRSIAKSHNFRAGTVKIATKLLEMLSNQPIFNPF